MKEIKARAEIIMGARAAIVLRGNVGVGLTGIEMCIRLVGDESGGRK